MIQSYGQILFKKKKKKLSNKIFNLLVQKQKYI